jgi:hypothetical protein
MCLGGGGNAPLELWTAGQPKFKISTAGTMTAVNGATIDPAAVSGGAAPATAQYWLGGADASLANGKNLGGLATALVLNTAGVPSAYAGIDCTNQFIRDVSAAGVGTCGTVNLAADITGTLPFANGGVMSQITKPNSTTRTGDDSIDADPELTIPVTAGQIYIYYGHLIVQSPAAADFKLAMAGPDSTVSTGVNCGAAATPTSFTSTNGNAAFPITCGTVDASTHSIDFTGRAVVSTNGNLAISWAQGTSNGGNTVVVAGSWIMFMRTQ